MQFINFLRDCVYLISVIFMEILKYTVKNTKDIGNDIRVFTLSPNEKKLEFNAGQFTMIHLLDKQLNPTDKRPYSIGSSPTRNELVFFIKLVGGRFTSKLEKINPGDILGIEGAFGEFYFHDENKSAFIAGGTGIAPFISIIDYINDKKKTGDYVLFYSSKTKNSIVERLRLERISEKNPNIRIVFTLTREEIRNGKYETGRVNVEMLGRHIKDPTGYNWYLCGPMKMTMELRNSLINEKQVPKEKIRFEGWG